MSAALPGGHRTLRAIVFATLVATQLAFAAIMPAGLGNDENGHLFRMWALTEGHFNCATVPRAVRELEALNLRPFKEHPRSFAAYRARGLSLVGGADRVDGQNYECSYFPLGVALPALVTRFVALDSAGVPRPGGVFKATYAARLVSLLTVDVALAFFLCVVPWAGGFALAFFANPMVIEQTVSVGHDGMILSLCLLLLATVLSSDGWRAIATVCFLAALMTVIKPVYAFFGLLALPAVVRRTPSWRALSAWQKFVAFGAAWPMLAYAAWATLGDAVHKQWRPGYTDPKAQALGLLNPLHAIRVLVGYLQYFIDDQRLPDFIPHRINGRWSTLFFANCWFGLPIFAYVAAIAGLTLAFAADAISPVRAPPSPLVQTRAQRWARRLAVGGVVATIPATIFAMYLIFTPVGAPGPYGVQGRYHAVAWLTLAVLGIGALQRRGRARRGSLALATAGAAFLVAADVWALDTIARYYWTAL